MGFGVWGLGLLKCCQSMEGGLETVPDDQRSLRYSFPAYKPNSLLRSSRLGQVLSILLSSLGSSMPRVFADDLARTVLRSPGAISVQVPRQSLLAPNKGVLQQKAPQLSLGFFLNKVISQPKNGSLCSTKLGTRTTVQGMNCLSFEQGM